MQPLPETIHFNKMTDEQVIEALQEAKGLINYAAKNLGLKSSTSLRSRIKKNPVLNQALTDIRKDNINKAEQKLLDAIDNGEQWAIKFYLETIGKDEGYTYQTNINMNANIVNENIDLGKLSMEELEKLNEIIGKSTTYENSDRSGDI